MKKPATAQPTAKPNQRPEEPLERVAMGAAERSSVPPGILTAPSLSPYLGSRDAVPPPPRPATAQAPTDDDRLRARLVAEARAILEGRKRFRDCSSFILGVYRAAGITLKPLPLPRGRSMSESLYRASTQIPVARPGDIAVFHNTYDRNRDGKRNDRYTHISLVESIDGDVVTFIHRGSRGVARHRMNLRAPTDRTTNDALRTGGAGRVLAGQLFAGFGDLVTQAPDGP